MSNVTFTRKNEVVVDGNIVGTLYVYSEQRNGMRVADAFMIIAGADGSITRIDTHQLYQADAKRWIKNKIEEKGLQELIRIYGE